MGVTCLASCGPREDSATSVAALPFAGDLSPTQRRIFASHVRQSWNQACQRLAVGPCPIEEKDSNLPIAVLYMQEGTRELRVCSGLAQLSAPMIEFVMAHEAAHLALRHFEIGVMAEVVVFYGPLSMSLAAKALIDGFDLAADRLAVHCLTMLGYSQERAVNTMLGTLQTVKAIVEKNSLENETNGLVVRIAAAEELVKACCPNAGSSGSCVGR